MLSGGEIIRMWPLGERAQVRQTQLRAEERATGVDLMHQIKSASLSVSGVSVGLMALALFTRMSIPPKVSTRPGDSLGYLCVVPDIDGQRECATPAASISPQPYKLCQAASDAAPWFWPRSRMFARHRPPLVAR